MKIYNSQTRKKEIFEPLDSEHVTLYVCGPTVYSYAHIGNARPPVVFDILVRVLRQLYPKVTYVRNITDIDDKINKAAAAESVSIGVISERFTKAYHEDLAALGVRHPDKEPRVTDHLDEITDMIKRLIDKGHAYEAEGHVLFHVKSYADYGQLSGRDPEELMAGARVEVAPYKKDPGDFVLWKPSAEDQPGWDSPWGRGRPGWHIECSAMAHELLGKAFDIHGGGNDLMFPHHENEIAQSKCVGDDFASIWMHNEMLQVEGKKMSKSLGNFFTVRDLLDQGVPGEVIRFVFLSTHYRKPMDWTAEKAKEAEKTLRKWQALTDGIDEGRVTATVIHAIADDLNTAGAIAEMHKLANAEDASSLKAAGRLLGLLSDAKEDWLSDGAEFGVTNHLRLFANTLNSLRTEAMKTKNFSKLDALKTQLSDIGIKTMQTKEGIQLEIDWFGAYQAMLIAKKDPRFVRVTGVNRRETWEWLKKEIEALV